MKLFAKLSEADKAGNLTSLLQGLLNAWSLTYPVGCQARWGGGYLRLDRRQII